MMLYFGKINTTCREFKTHPFIFPFIRRYNDLMKHVTINWCSPSWKKWLLAFLQSVYVTVPAHWFALVQTLTWALLFIWDFLPWWAVHDLSHCWPQVWERMCPLDALPATDQTQGSAWFLPFLSSLFFRLLPSLFWCSLCCSMVPTSPGRATPIAMWPESKAGRKSLCPGSEFQAISAVLLPCPGQAESWPLASSFYFILFKIFFYKFIYLFMAALGLRCCMRALL